MPPSCNPSPRPRLVGKLQSFMDVSAAAGLESGSYGTNTMRAPDIRRLQKAGWFEPKKR